MIILKDVKIAISGEILLDLINTGEDSFPEIGTEICGYTLGPGSTLTDAVDGVQYIAADDKWSNLTTITEAAEA